ncbi:hypothetical protein [Mesorhizobium sp. M0243]|uniref:hypothetical protein n=1 Tax=Mesorhizobium sp. M0243 TaxID=2956925 RepID=UPI00333CAF0C
MEQGRLDVAPWLPDSQFNTDLILLINCPAMVACKGRLEGSSGCLHCSYQKARRLSHVSDGRILSAARKREILVDLREGFFRICALAFAGMFVYRGVYHLMLDPTRINVALVAISEILTFTWLLLSRRPQVRDWNPLTVVVRWSPASVSASSTWNRAWPSSRSMPLRRCKSWRWGS